MGDKEKDLPEIPAMLRGRVRLKWVKNGIKMTYVRSRHWIWVGVMILMLLYCGKQTMGDLFVEMVGATLLLLVIIVLAYLPLMYRCKIIFTPWYMHYSDQTLGFPTTHRLRRFATHWIEVDSIQLRGVRNTQHPGVEINTRYEKIGIFHTAMVDAKAHAKLIDKCIELTAESQDSKEVPDSKPT